MFERIVIYFSKLVAITLRKQLIFTMNHCEMVYVQENKCRAAYQADDAKSILPSDAGKVISLLS